MWQGGLPGVPSEAAINGCKQFSVRPRCRSVTAIDNKRPQNLNKPGITRLRAVLLFAVSISACHIMPKELPELAELISDRGYGNTTAWLLGGNVVAINIEDAPQFNAPQKSLEKAALLMAELSIKHVSTPLESISVTFYPHEISDDPESMRELIFLVRDNRPEPLNLPDT